LADYELVEKAADLRALCRHLEKEPVVAFDTEADSFYHYFDKTCLIQVADRKNNWLIDPLVLDPVEESKEKPGFWFESGRRGEGVAGE